MILLTVGTQLPFDRFVEMVDRLAPMLPEPVFAQVGQGRYQPANMDWRAFIGPIEFEQRIAECSLVVSHAGIGTVVMAQKHRKPMILFPRREAYDEHRNDHQLATVRELNGRSGISVALHEDELSRHLFAHHPRPAPVQQLPERDRLCRAVAGLLTDERHRRAGRHRA